MNSVILKTATRLLAGLILVISVYLLWQGHHAPGGGFIAALVASTGLSLAALSEGPAAVRRGLRISPRHLMGAGVLLVLVSGAAGLSGGHPFLTGLWWPAQKALTGTPFFFDTGVFLVVLGAILTVLLAMEEA